MKLTDQQLHAEPAGWLVSIERGPWLFYRTDPASTIGDVCAVIRPACFADGNDWREPEAAGNKVTNGDAA